MTKPDFEEKERLMKTIEMIQKQLRRQEESNDGLILNDLGDLIPLESWIETVKSRGFIDYDGMGHFATATHHAGGAHNWVYPSDVEQGKFHPPAWATHILWYNR